MISRSTLYTGTLYKALHSAGGIRRPLRWPRNARKTKYVKRTEVRSRFMTGANWRL